MVRVPSILSRYPELADVNAIIQGKIAEARMGSRQIKLAQRPDIYSFGHAKEVRTETVDIRFAEPVIHERVLSLLSANYTYSPGAAHGNTGYQSQVFLLTPLLKIGRLETVFQDASKALKVVREEARHRLLAPRSSEGGEPYALDKAWVDGGTEDWAAFQVFRFLENGLELTFPPYAVACYADGPQTVVLPWKTLAPLLRSDYAAAAGVGHLLLGDPPWTIEAAAGTIDVTG